MKESDRDELLIRLDERSASMATTLKSLAIVVDNHGQRIDRLEFRKRDDGERRGILVSFLEFVGALPSAWHVILSILMASVGIVAFARAYIK